MDVRERLAVAFYRERRRFPSSWPSPAWPSPPRPLSQQTACARGRRRRHGVPHAAARLRHGLPIRLMPTCGEALHEIREASPAPWPAHVLAGAPPCASASCNRQSEGARLAAAGARAMPTPFDLTERCRPGGVCNVPDSGRRRAIK
ncbi:MAG: hypothetical protein ACLTDR_06745 [Adlercreutzia equolifaciens]